MIEYIITPEELKWRDRYAPTLKKIKEIASIGVSDAKEFITSQRTNETVKLKECMDKYTGKLSPANATLFNMEKRPFNSSDLVSVELPYDDSSFVVNVYGPIISGTKAADPTELERALQGSATYNEVIGSPVFDIEKNIHIIISSDSFVGVDVSELLVRYMNTGLFVADAEVLEKEIEQVVFNKCVSYSLAKHSLLSAVEDTKTSTAIRLNLKDNNVDRIYGIMLDKVYYNIVNGIDKNYNTYKEMQFIMKSDHKTTDTKWNIRTVFEMFLYRLLGKETEMLRFLDKMLMFARFRVNEEPGQHIFYVHYGSIHNSEWIDVCLRKFKEEAVAKLAVENHNTYDDRLVIGAENLTGMLSKEYNVPRSKILGKLNTVDRKRYINIENDFMLLRTQMSSCHSPEAQQTLIKRCNMLGNVIQLELERTSNEYMITLLNMLDDVRIDVMNVLSVKDFFKERNSRLYGMDRGSNRWDF